MQYHSSVGNVALLEQSITGAYLDCMGSVLEPAGAPSVSSVAGSLSQLSWQSSAHFRSPRCSDLLERRQALMETCAHACALSGCYPACCSQISGLFLLKEGAVWGVLYATAAVVMQIAGAAVTPVGF